MDFNEEIKKYAARREAALSTRAKAVRAVKRAAGRIDWELVGIAVATAVAILVVLTIVNFPGGN